MLSIAEAYGPTVNVDGPLAGRHCLVIEMGDGSKEGFTVDQVISRLGDLWPVNEKPTLVTIKGKDPLAQKDGIKELISALDALGCTALIETEGKIPLDEELKYFVEYGSLSFTIIPVLIGMESLADLNVESLSEFMNAGSAFRFTASDDEGMTIIEKVVEMVTIPRNQVWISPQDVLSLEDFVFYSATADKAVNDHGWNVSQAVEDLFMGAERSI